MGIRYRFRGEVVRDLLHLGGVRLGRQTVITMRGRQPLLGVDYSAPKQGVPLLVLAQVLIHEVAPDIDIEIVLLLVLVLACLKIFTQSLL